MMTILYVLIGITLWLSFGYLAAGFNFAYSQGKWPMRAGADFKQDRAEAIGPIFFGFFYLLVTIAGGFWAFGWKNPFTKEQ